MVDTADLKSSDACVVPVRVRPPAPRRSKLYIACSDLFYKSERAHAAAPPFQIEPAALGFDLVFSFFGHISSISPLVPKSVKLLRSLTQLVEKAHLGWTFSSKFQLFHSVECLAELIAADGAGNAHMPLARFAECRAVCDKHMRLFKQPGAEPGRVELCFPYRREEIKRSVRLVKPKIRYAPYPRGRAAPASPRAVKRTALCRSARRLSSAWFL